MSSTRKLWIGLAALLVASFSVLLWAGGEIFRAAKFYDDGLGSYVRTLAPQVDGGGSGSDDGKWFRTTMTCDFTYWHRG